MKLRRRSQLAWVTAMLLIFCLVWNGVVSAATEPPEDTPEPTATEAPTEEPTEAPTEEPTTAPTEEPTSAPTEEPTIGPTVGPEDPTSPPTPTPRPTSGATATPGPTSTPMPTMTPTGTPYATVIPPKPDAVFPSPAVSDKSIGAKQPDVITIDGSYDSLWERLPSYPIRNVSWGEEGAMGSFKIAWDLRTLYVLVEVTDITPDTSASLFSRMDCVELFLNESGTKPTEYAAGDQHYKISRDGRLELGNGAGADYIDFVVTETENGYWVEAAITFLSVAAAQGTQIGFDVRVNDAQGSGNRDYMIQWSDTSMMTFTDLSKVGTVTLR